MKCLFFMYSFTQQIMCICYLSSFFTSPDLSFCQMHIPFLFLSGFVEICCSASLFLCPSPSSTGTHTFPPCSLLSALLFPWINCNPALSFCIAGSGVQQNIRPRAAYLDAIGLHSRKSHKNCIKYWSGEIVAGWIGSEYYSIKISIGFLSPLATFAILIYRGKKIKTNTILFPNVCLSVCWCAGRSTVILQSVWGCGRAAGVMVPQPACAAAAVLWNRHGASVITSIITATQRRAPETRKTRIEGAHNVTHKNLTLTRAHQQIERVRPQSRLVRGKRMRKKVAAKKKSSF